MNIHSNDLVIGFVGRIAKVKGLDVLLKAVSKLNRSDIKVILSGPDFGAMEALKELAVIVGIADKVHFLGSQSKKNLPYIFHMCDILTLPSYGGESFGITLIEAMACRKPVIGSATGGIPELINDGMNGFIFKVGSVDQLAEKINTLSRDPKARTVMGSNGRSMVEACYTWDIVADKYMSLFHGQ